MKNLVSFIYLFDLLFIVIINIVFVLLLLILLSLLLLSFFTAELKNMEYFFLFLAENCNEVRL